MVKIKFPKIELNNIKAVLIDIDNTLYQYNPCHKYALEHCRLSALEYVDSFDISLFDELYKKHRMLITQSLHPQGCCRSRFLAFMNMFEELGLISPFDLAYKFNNIYWEKFIEVMKLEEDANNFIQAVHSQKILLVAVTDMVAEVQVRKLSRLNVNHFFNFLVTSEEAGEEKPSKKIFQLALNKINMKPNDVIMVGDDIKKDMVGAENMNIKFYKVDAPNE